MGRYDTAAWQAPETVPRADAKWKGSKSSQSEMHRSDLDKDETREVDVDCERKLKDILTRKWCVGEMVTARIQKVGLGRIAETGSGFF